MFERLRLKVISLMICFVAFSLVSCSRKGPDIVQLGPVPETACRVAVMPFINRTEYQDGNVLLYRVFAAELSSLGDLEVVPEGDIRKAFRQVRVSPGLKQPNYDQLQIIGDYLNTDILIGGTILQMEEITRNGEKIPQMTIMLHVIDSQTGQKVWSIYHVRDGAQYRKVMHFGVISTITQLSRQMSKEILESWISQGTIGKCLK